MVLMRRRPACLRENEEHLSVVFTAQSILHSAPPTVHSFLFPSLFKSSLSPPPPSNKPSIPQVPSSGRLDFMRKYSLHPYSLKLDLATDLWSEVAVLVMTRQEIIKVLAALKVRTWSCACSDRAEFDDCFAMLHGHSFMPTSVTCYYQKQTACFTSEFRHSSDLDFIVLMANRLCSCCDQH